MFKRLVSLVEHHVGYPTVVVVLSLLSASALYAQAPAMEWFKGYGPSNGIHPHEGMQTSDGGYIAIGHSPEASSPGMVIVKVDSNGDEEWTRVINTSGVGICIAEVSDGFICGGGLVNGGNQKPALVKLNLNGNIVSGWPKYYSGSRNCAVRGIDILADGSIVATGYKNSGEGQGFVFIVDDGDGFVMKTDAAGNVIWDKGLSVPQGTKVRQISTGFAVCSTDWYWSGKDHQDAVLIKTDGSGNETNTYHFGGTDNEHCYDFDLTSDGGYILAGHTTSYGVANWDLYLVKVNSSGSEEWHQTFGQPRGYNADYIHDEGYGVRQTPDGGYIMTAGTGDEYSYSSCSSPCGCSDQWMAYLVRTDSSGNLLWEGVYPCGGGYGGNNAGEYLGLTSDGGYMIFVDSDSFGIEGCGVGFMKIASDTPPPPPLPTPDIDGSGDVNFVDYSLFAPQWMRTECNDCNGADFTGEGDVDVNDLDIFVDNWLRDYSLVGYWKLDTDANDSSGYGNDGTVYGGAVWVDDSNRGWCLSFDGDDYVQVPADVSLNAGDITMAAWIKASNATPDSGMHVLNRQMTNPGTYLLWLDKSNYKWGAQIRLDGDEGNGIKIYSNDVASTDWTHIAATYDGSVFKLYINGILQADTATVVGSIDDDSSGILTIGAHPDPRFYFEGLIDEVHIYDKALNQQAIEALAGI